MPTVYSRQQKEIVGWETSPDTRLFVVCLSTAAGGREQKRPLRIPGRPSSTRGRVLVIRVRTPSEMTPRMPGSNRLSRTPVQWRPFDV